MLRQLIAPLTVAALAPVAAAESPHWYASGGYAFEGTRGWELEFGGQVDWNDRVYLFASPADFVFFDGDPPEGFYRDTFSNGQSRCRNASNGQFAPDENCVGEGDMEWRATVGGQLRLTDNILIGGGALYTFESDIEERAETWDGFGSFTWEFSRTFGVQLRGGAEYASLQARIAF
jgi:hypothetical protein